MGAGGGPGTPRARDFPPPGRTRGANGLSSAPRPAGYAASAAAGRATRGGGPPAPGRGPAPAPAEAPAPEPAPAAPPAPALPAPAGEVVLVPAPAVWARVDESLAAGPGAPAAPAPPGVTPLPASPVTEPLLSLQGLDPAARVALMRCAVAALREHCDGIPAAAWGADAEGWAELVRGARAASAAAAARAWLGYVPADVAAAVDEWGARARGRGAVPAGAVPAGAVPAGAAPAPLPGSPGRRLLPWRRGAAAAAGPGGGAGVAGAGEDADAERDGDGADLFAAFDGRTHVHAAVLRYLRFSAEVEAELRAACGAGGGAGVGSPPAPAMRAALRARVGGQLGTLASAGAVLEDLSVAVADAVAQAYLGEARRGGEGGALLAARDRGGALGARGWPLFLHARIQSTRQLERFRNQVSLRRAAGWLWHDVVDIFEDAHPLLGLRGDGGVVARRLAGRRGDELGRLRGARLWVSVALEAGDVALPLLRALWGRLGEAASWLLVGLVGRALGLVWAGIRQASRGAGGRGRGAGGGAGPGGEGAGGASPWHPAGAW